MDATQVTLIDRLRDARDSLAWREFFALWHPIITAYVWRRTHGTVDPDDIVQDVFGILVARLPKFEYDPAKGRFRNWMLTIVDNQIKQQFRKRRDQRAATAILDALADPDDSRAMWEPIVIREQMKICLDLARREFSAETFETFRRSFVDEEPTKDICADMNVTPNKVHLARHRVLRRLKELMVEQTGYDG